MLLPVRPSKSGPEFLHTHQSILRPYFSQSQLTSGLVISISVIFCRKHNIASVFSIAPNDVSQQIAQTRGGKAEWVHFSPLLACLLEPELVNGQVGGKLLDSQDF